MVGVTIEVKNEQVAARLQRLAKPDLSVALESIGQLFVAKAKDNIARRAGPDGPWPRTAYTDLFAGARIWMDVERSMHASVEDAGAGGHGATLSVGSPHIAAGVRQLGTRGAGGTKPDIVPTKRRALTIPLTDAASRASYNGIDAKTAFPDGFILKPGDGASPLNVGVIARRVGGRTNKKTGQKEGHALELLYLLVRRVAIRPHAFLPVSKDGTVKPERLWDEAKDVVAASVTKG